MFRRLLSSNPAPAASSPKPSASAIVAETVAGSHVLAVKGFSWTMGRLGNGEFIGSQIFNVGGCSWIILYYPDGRGSGNADCVSISLQLDKTSAGANDAKARCTFSLLDDDGRPVPSHSYASNRILGFTSKGDPWGIHIRRKVLEQWPYLRDDCFRVRCDVTVYKGIIRKEEDDSAGRFVYVPPSDVHRHLGRLLEGGEGADVAFEVAGETVAAHRCILASRSPVFMAELFGPMKEGTSARVRVDDMDAGAFKALLHFVYTDALADTTEEDDGDEKVVAMAQHVLVAADRYGIDRLRLICEDKLCGYVDARNVGTILALAEQHHCNGLKRACFKFLMSGNNLKAAVATTGFEHLSNSCPSVLKELLAKASTLLPD